MVGRWERRKFSLNIITLVRSGASAARNRLQVEYFPEFLSRICEDHLKKIVLVQAFVRRWLAVRIFKKTKLEKEQNILTLQRHVRGWLTRKRFQLLKDKQIAEKIMKERKEEQREERKVSGDVQGISRSALLRKLNLQKEMQDKKNLAAVVIQTCELINALLTLEN